METIYRGDQEIASLARRVESMETSDLIDKTLAAE
jgi:hypothetical protein